MLPKFANPHSLSQDVEKTTRSELAERAGFTSIIHDEDNHSLKRDLDTLLRDTWADALAEASKAKKLRHMGDDHKNEDEQPTFLLLSSMKHPRHISLHPKPSPRIVHGSREPECADDETQAETRKMRSLSVAVDGESLKVAAVSKRQIDLKPVTLGAKVPLIDISLATLPRLLVTEEARAGRTIRRVKNGGTRAHEGFVASPHEPRLSCTVLPVMSASADQREMSGKKRRKPGRERPPPAYWRPPPGLRGKCMGYALGYQSSWVPDWPYDDKGPI